MGQVELHPPLSLDSSPRLRPRASGRTTGRGQYGTRRLALRTTIGAQQLRGRGQGCPEEEALRNRFTGGPLDLDGSALRCATDGATATASYTGAEPFLHRSSRNSDPVRLGGVGLERRLVYLQYLETWLNAQRLQRLSELLYRALHLLIRSVAAVARLAPGHESLPKNR